MRKINETNHLPLVYSCSNNAQLANQFAVDFIKVGDAEISSIAGF